MDSTAVCFQKTLLCHFKTPILKLKNILVVTYWSFDNALIQTYTLPYIQIIKDQIPAGSKIYLLTLAQKDAMKKVAILDQVEKLKSNNIHLINFNYSAFGWYMIFKLIFIITYLSFFCWFKKISFIHAWCTPGGAIAYPISVLTGAPLILDSFEPHAESMVENRTWNKEGIAFKLMFLFEKLQLKRAKEVICASQGMIQHSQKFYRIKKERYFIKPACVDLNLFNPSSSGISTPPPLKLNGTICVYAGKFGGIYLEREVFDFFKVAYDYWKGKFTVLLLSNHSDDEIRAYCRESLLPYEVIQKVFVPHADVPAYLKLGDFGICPVKPVSSKQFCSPIKNGEYWAMGLPVVITNNISVDSSIIGKNQIGYVLKYLSKEEYENAVIKIDALLKTDDLKVRIRNIAIQERNFNLAEAVYKTIYAEN